MEGKRPRGSSRIRWIDQIRNDMEIRREKYNTIGIKMAEDFPVIID